MRPQYLSDRPMSDEVDISSHVQVTDGADWGKDVKRDWAEEERGEVVRGVVLV